MAQAIVEGAKEVEGAEVDFRIVPIWGLDHCRQ